MRLWSLHPKFMDQKGLGASWREGLLAQAVLMGKTKGYKNHSQLQRFKQMEDPVQAICNYLHGVCVEAHRRDYNFNKDLIAVSADHTLQIPVTRGQIQYERDWLVHKLFSRSIKTYMDIRSMELITHPLFSIRQSEELEPWEKY